MKYKAHRPADMEIKPARDPTETRGLQNLPSLLQGLAEAQHGGQASPAPQPAPQGSTEGDGAGQARGGQGGNAGE